MAQLSQTEIDHLAQVVWDYHHLNQPLVKADAIFVLGSHDIEVAEYAADLFIKKYAPFIIFSGGLTHNEDLLRTGWTEPEAEIFAKVALEMGVPKEKMLLENKSRNTGENILFTRELLKANNLDFDSFLLVQKPYMERRTYATFKKQWPEQRFTVTSPPISYLDYVARNSKGLSREKVISIMVGDLECIIEYPALGFQIYQEVPANVIDAYNKLIAAGFDKHLIT